MSSIESTLRNIVQDSSDTDQAHDLGHIERVVAMCKHLASFESGVNLEVLIPAAWLHDIVSFAKNSAQRSSSSRKAAEYAAKLLNEIIADETFIPEICHAIEAHSFSAKIAPQSIEAKILQDADRLDAIGAHGLVRCIQVGTELELKLYDRDDPFAKARELDDKSFTLDHFETKLLHLSEGMHTKEAKRLAQERDKFLKDFLLQVERELSSEVLHNIKQEEEHKSANSSSC